MRVIDIILHIETDSRDVYRTVEKKGNGYTRRVINRRVLNMEKKRGV